MTKQPAASEANPAFSSAPVNPGPRHAPQEDIPSPAVESVRRATDAINATVNRKRAQIEADPDDLIDKFLKFAFPAIASFVAGKAFEMLWSRGTGWKPAAKGAAKGPLMQSILFAAFSAAAGALVSGISERGSQSLVDRRHRAAASKAAKAK